MAEPGVAVRQNLRKTFERVADHSPRGEVQDFDGVTAVSAGVPTPTFNRVFVFEPFEPADLTAGIEWFRNREEPFWVTALVERRDAIEAALSDFEYEESETPQPGMARELSPDLPKPDTPAEISAVTASSGMDAWVSAAEAVFDFSPETTRLLTPPSILDDDDLQFLVGRADGDVAACGILYVDAAVAGVYVIGVAEEFRRRGIGEAMTWALLREGQQRGASLGVLQSTDMGYPLYEQMGFQTEVKFWHYALDD